MTDPYEVVVSVPADPELTSQEQEDLKDKFKDSVIETLGDKIEGREVEAQLCTGGGAREA
jgi:hypothetical protein